MVTPRSSAEKLVEQCADLLPIRAYLDGQYHDTKKKKEMAKPFAKLVAQKIIETFPLDHPRQGEHMIYWQKVGEEIYNL